jgi:hypothetical protein
MHLFLLTLLGKKVKQTKEWLQPNFRISVDAIANDKTVQIMGNSIAEYL